MRIALGVEYDGTNYHGWQRQSGISTVQEKIEQALSLVAAKTVLTTCAGRTDAGVHAAGQVIHFDTKAERSDQSWILGTNSNLPGDIRILWARHVSPDFHARYQAISRHYRYLIYNHKIASALLRHRAMWWPYPLHEELMREAAINLLGTHDFSSFRGRGCQAKSATRQVISLEITRARGMVNIDIKANAFLLHMVRNIVGVLVKIGTRERSPVWAKEVLLARDRRQAATTATACGLYLVAIEYANLASE